MGGAKKSKGHSWAVCKILNKTSVSPVDLARYAASIPKRIPIDRFEVAVARLFITTQCNKYNWSARQGKLNYPFGSPTELNLSTAIGRVQSLPPAKLIKKFIQKNLVRFLKYVSQLRVFRCAFSHRSNFKYLTRTTYYTKCWIVCNWPKRKSYCKWMKKYCVLKSFYFIRPFPQKHASKKVNNKIIS